MKRLLITIFAVLIGFCSYSQENVDSEKGKKECLDHAKQLLNTMFGYDVDMETEMGIEYLFSEKDEVEENVIVSTYVIQNKKNYPFEQKPVMQYKVRYNVQNGDFLSLRFMLIKVQ